MGKFELEEPISNCRQGDCVGIHLHEHFLSYYMICVVDTFYNLILIQPYKVDYYNFKNRETKV